jgi:hypothetical protein
MSTFCVAGGTQLRFSGHLRAPDLRNDSTAVIDGAHGGDPGPVLELEVVVGGPEEGLPDPGDLDVLNVVADRHGRPRPRVCVAVLAAFARIVIAASPLWLSPRKAFTHLSHPTG